MAVYFYGCITLDGYMAAKGHGLDWLYDTGSPEETSYDEFYSHMDVTLMGRRTFQEIEKTGDPASVYPTTENYVFTHRELSCPGFTAVSGDPAEFVKKLGQDRSIWVVGGNTILAPLLDQDMVAVSSFRWLRYCWARGSLCLRRRKPCAGSGWKPSGSTGSLRSWCMAGDNRGRSSPTAFFALHSREGHAILTAERLA